MSRLGFQLFRASIKRTGAATSRRQTALRYISSGPSIGWGVNSPIPVELCFIPFRLLGPPEVRRSPFIVNSFLDDKREDELEDESDDELVYQVGFDENPCFTLFRTFIHKERSCNCLFLRRDDHLHYALDLSWRHCPQTTLELICHLKNTTRLGKLRREDFYTAALWLHRHHSETLAYNVREFARFGCLKDFLEILYRIVNGPQVRHNQMMVRMRVRKAKRRKQGKITKPRVLILQETRITRTNKAIGRYNCDPKYRFLHDQISNLFAELLKADLEYLISGQVAKISLASKWCPSLYSSYDRSTLFCESVARKLFPRDACPEYREIDEAHYAYRVRDRLRKQVLVPLRRALELPEIYMSANQWNLLRYDRITSKAMKTYKRLFYKHDEHRFSQHLFLNVNSPKKMPKTTNKELLPYEILRSFFHHRTIHAELQWKRMIDTYCSKGKFVNCVSVVHTSVFCMGSSTYTKKFCIAFTLMTSELCASPWRGKMLTHSKKPEFVNIEGDDLGSRISSLRYQAMGESLELIQLLDKILETAKDLKLAKENMIERVFVFDHSIIHSNFSIDWEEDYGAMEEKYKRNGYVMPKIVCWHHRVLNASPRVSVKGGITKIVGGLEASFRIFLESDGILSPTVGMESEICSEDYPRFVVRD
ncbi:uncharacterized protein LOC133867840 [Alnus glutinosa]|uniref:uncharacterized protein LOC133867840 n=1 Tax=Alnus glutinosa TaxID=3517 RepID=UPI002D78C374|nr:uncharacterized protein LOC133867840 [Alnus glutinosa]XP_062160596.1 uncharacterized protein LOC133867840 [Alnus glutinosa]